MTAARDNATLGTVGVIAACVLAIVAAMQWIGDPDVKLARSVFKKLVGGRQSVAKQIDWSQLTALDANVGQAYRQLTDPRDKEAYRRMFVISFAEGFRRSGSSANDYKAWRIAKREGGKIVVVADMPRMRKSLLFTVSPVEGKRVLTGVQFAGIAASQPVTARPMHQSEAPVAAPPAAAQ